MFDSEKIKTKQTGPARVIDGTDSTDNFFERGEMPTVTPTATARGVGCHEGGRSSSSGSQSIERWAVLPTEHFSHNEDEYCSAKAGCLSAADALGTGVSAPMER
jgi:hypothetical protein